MTSYLCWLLLLWMPFVSWVPHKGPSGIVGTPKDNPVRRMERVADDNFRYPLATRRPHCTKARPPLFTHLDVRVSCNNLCHMASTLSVVSCWICQAHSPLRHTLTYTAMHIDYARLYAFDCHLLNTGVYIVQTHYVKRDMSYTLCGRTSAFIHISKLTLELFTIKSYFICALRHIFW